MPFAYPFAFFFGGPPPTTDANGCWIGLPSTFELQLIQPLKDYALEQLRVRLLYALTTTHDVTQSARVLLQMAFETEVGVILVKMIDAVPSVRESKVCPRRHFLEVDADLRANRFLIEPALAALSEHVPEPYIELLRRHLGSDYPRYRVCATAAVICLAVATS